MKDDVKGLYIAVILSIAIIFVTNALLPKKTPTTIANDTVIAEVETPKDIKNDVKEPEVEKTYAPEEIITQDKRINIQNAALRGSIRVKGARFDDLLLEKYKQTLEDSSPDVELLYPAKTATPYYAEFGWLSTDKEIKTPDKNTIWTVKGSQLTPNTPIVLEWNNGQGLKFVRKISLDNDYMFNIDQNVENNTGRNITLYPYGLINKTIGAENSASSVVHQGLTGVFDKNLQELKYKDLENKDKKEFKTTGGWGGFSDHYWFSAMIFNKDSSQTVKLSNTDKHSYQVDYVGSPVVIDAGAVGNNNVRFFAGAKEIKLLDNYTKKLGIEKFDLAVDFGWYYFLTKPFFYILDFLFNMIGNMGWAILLFAALLRLCMFPIANKSYESMSKMKKVQPKLKELQEKFKDDKVKLQQETMILYRKDKINPAAGCLPMLIQIPVFFSLYKVLNIAIEIRHAPFIGWIKDLSAPDPLTLSVLLHFPIPGLLNIGVWPIVMGLTMFIQQKLNPAPTNKDQARMFAMMPLIFTFMLGHFASGLVIYWTLSNILSIVQQKAIMKKNGV